MLSALNKVDVFSQGPGGTRLSLVIEAGEWQEPGSLLLLREKINNYAAFALDGEMHRKFPDSQGSHVTIAICPVDPLPLDIAKFIDQVATILAKDGLTVTVEPLPAAEAA
jgi:hypothetical protein